MNLNKFYFLILLLIHLCISEKSKAIVGGNFVSTTKYPSILKSKECSFTKIAPEFLMTAAHCIGFLPGIGFRSSPLRLTVGVDGIQKPIDLQLKIKKLYIPPDYFENHQTIGLNLDEIGFDLALVQVQSDPEFDKLPALPLYLKSLELNQSVSIVGYGSYLDRLVSEAEKHLAENDYLDPIRRIGLLKEANPIVTKLDPTFISTSDFNAEGGSTRAYKGDSGGPLIVVENQAHAIAGVASITDFGGGNCRFTRLDPLKNWITDVLNEKAEAIVELNDLTMVREQKRVAGEVAIKLAKLAPESFNDENIVFSCNANWNTDHFNSFIPATYSGSCQIQQKLRTRQIDLPLELLETFLQTQIMGTWSNGFDSGANLKDSILKCDYERILNKEHLICELTEDL